MICNKHLTRNINCPCPTCEGEKADEKPNFIKSGGAIVFCSRWLGAVDVTSNFGDPCSIAIPAKKDEIVDHKTRPLVVLNAAIKNIEDHLDSTHEVIKSHKDKIEATKGHIERYTRDIERMLGEINALKAAIEIIEREGRF